MDEDLYSFADKAVLTGPNGPKDNKKADTERYLSDNIQEKPVKRCDSFCTKLLSV